MKRKISLPLGDSIYQTDHCQGSTAAVTVQNPSVRNWILCHCLMLQCTRKFLSGYTTPQVHIRNSKINENPYIERRNFSVQFLLNCLTKVIKNLLNEGYYVHFYGADDYYLEGKSWYRQRHFVHDGLICGYDENDKTYEIFAYDANWVYTRFRVKQSSVVKAIHRAAADTGEYGGLIGIRASKWPAYFHVSDAVALLKEYGNADLQKYPPEGEGLVEGIAVQEYLKWYLERIRDGQIPYERIDKRIFRLLWEHKKCVLECLRNIEQTLGMGCIPRENVLPSAAYGEIVQQADLIRMIYARYSIKREDKLLDFINGKLMYLKDREQSILSSAVQQAESILRMKEEK